MTSAPQFNPTHIIKEDKDKTVGDKKRSDLHAQEQINLILDKSFGCLAIGMNILVTFVMPDHSRYCDYKNDHVLPKPIVCFYTLFYVFTRAYFSHDSLNEVISRSQRDKKDIVP